MPRITIHIPDEDTAVKVLEALHNTMPDARSMKRDNFFNAAEENIFAQSVVSEGIPLIIA